MRTHNTTLWKISCLSAIILSVITFTPLVIPYHTYKPAMLGLPYTLWMGVLVAICFVTLTFIGTRVHPGRNEEDE